jgi:hypothetical protein
VADPAVDRVILRDVDSYVGQREADAVAEWVASGQPLHFMHDHAATMELQAGCVGFTRDFHPDILGLVMTFNHGLGELNQRGSFQQHVDQYILLELGPQSRDLVLMHSAYHCPPMVLMDTLPFPSGDEDGITFIGQVGPSHRIACRARPLAGSFGSARDTRTLCSASTQSTAAGQRRLCPVAFACGTCSAARSCAASRVRTRGTLDGPRQHVDISCAAQAFDEHKVDCYGLYRLPSRCRKGEFPTADEITIREPRLECEAASYTWVPETGANAPYAMQSATLEYACTACTIRPDQQVRIFVGGAENSQLHDPAVEWTAIQDPLNVSASMLAAVRPELRRKCYQKSDIRVHILPSDKERYRMDLVDGRYQVVPVLMQHHSLQGHVMTVTSANRIWLSFENDGLETTLPK